MDNGTILWCMYYLKGNDLVTEQKSLYYDSYHCEDVLILHNKLHFLPPILSDDTKVGRCNRCFSWKQLEVVTKSHPICQFCGGGNTRNLQREEEGETEGEVMVMHLGK